MSTALTVSMLNSELLLGQLEMKQRHLVSKMNVPDEKEGVPEEVTMESLGEILKLLSVLS